MARIEREHQFHQLCQQSGCENKEDDGADFISRVLRTLQKFVAAVSHVAYRIGGKSTEMADMLAKLEQDRVEDF